MDFCVLCTDFVWIYMYGFIQIFIFQKNGFLRKQSGNTTFAVGKMTTNENIRVLLQNSYTF